MWHRISEYMRNTPSLRLSDVEEAFGEVCTAFMENTARSGYSGQIRHTYLESSHLLPGSGIAKGGAETVARVKSKEKEGHDENAS